MASGQQAGSAARNVLFCARPESIPVGVRLSGYLGLVREHEFSKGSTTMRTKVTVACALTAFVVIAGGTAEAAGIINTSGIAKGAITFNRLAPNVQKMVSAKAVQFLSSAVAQKLSTVLRRSVDEVMAP